MAPLSKSAQGLTGIVLSWLLAVALVFGNAGQGKPAGAVSGAVIEQVVTVTLRAADPALAAGKPSVSPRTADDRAAPGPQGVAPDPVVPATRPLAIAAALAPPDGPAAHRNGHTPQQPRAPPFI